MAYLVLLAAGRGMSCLVVLPAGRGMSCLVLLAAGRGMSCLVLLAAGRGMSCLVLLAAGHGMSYLVVPPAGRGMSCQVVLAAGRGSVACPRSAGHRQQNQAARWVRYIGGACLLALRVDRRQGGAPPRQTPTPSGQQHPTSVVLGAEAIDLCYAVCFCYWPRALPSR